MKTIVMVMVVLGAAASAAAQGMETPGMQLSVSVGTTSFRSSFDEFDSDDSVSETTAGVGLALRLANHFALELDLAGTRGSDEEGFDAPDTYFATAGLKVPFPLGEGRFVPYGTIGGGIVRYDTSADFEDEFGEIERDWQVFLGGGLEFRFSETLGVRGDYRFIRVFAEDLQDIDLEREAYTAHRLTAGLTLAF